MILIIPAVDIMEGSCVRLVRGDPSKKKVYGDPIKAVQNFVNDGAEWIHLVDLDAAMGRQPNLNLLLKIVNQVNLKIEVAGGIRSVDKAERLIEAGASKVILGTSAILNPSFIEEVSVRVGKEHVAVSMDVNRGAVMIEGWTKQSNTNYNEALKVLNDYPFAHIIVTSVESDGTLEGPHLELIKECIALSKKPVYAAGGVKTIHDIKALVAIGAQGIIIGKSIYEGTITLPDALAEARNEEKTE